MFSAYDVTVVRFRVDVRVGAFFLSRAALIFLEFSYLFCRAAAACAAFAACASALNLLERLSCCAAAVVALPSTTTRADSSAVDF